jgi:hypothetical protein
MTEATGYLPRVTDNFLFAAAPGAYTTLSVAFLSARGRAKRFHCSNGTGELK